MGAPQEETHEETDEEVHQELLARAEKARQDSEASGSGSGPGGGAGPPSPDSLGKLVWLIVGIVVAAAAVVFAAVALGGGGKGSVATSTSTTVAGPGPRGTTPGGAPVTTPGTTPPGTVPPGFVTFRDDKNGLTISYPKEWRRLDPKDPSVSLIVNAGGSSVMLIDPFPPLASPATQENLPNLKAFTDGTIGAKPIQLLQQRYVPAPEGMLGYFYLYTFKDLDTAQDAVNAHYFFFRGRRWASIIFQAVPSDDFSRLAPAFDQVLATFRLDPDDPSAPPPASPAGTTPIPVPTTAAVPATTTPGAPPPAPPPSTP